MAQPQPHLHAFHAALLAAFPTHPDLARMLRFALDEELDAVAGAGLTPLPAAALGGLAARLGEWPLLLRLANGTLRAWLADAPGADAAVGRVRRALRRAAPLLAAAPPPLVRHPNHRRG